MSDLKNIAFSRIAEPLSKGENVKKLLELHISPYTNQVQKAGILEDLKDIDRSSGVFLEWFGILKGLPRPKTTINDQGLNQFFNVMTPDRAGFSEFDIAKPLFFGELNYFDIGDPEYKRIIKAYCKLTGFRGTMDEYSLFFKEIFGVNVQIRVPEYDLEFIIEDTNTLTIDIQMIEDLTPKLPQTKNSFFSSPYSLFSLEFNNIKGSNLDFSEEITTSFYFPF
jgi:hypothetical protein